MYFASFYFGQNVVTEFEYHTNGISGTPRLSRTALKHNRKKDLGARLAQTGLLILWVNCNTFVCNRYRGHVVYVDKCTQGCEIILCLLFKCNFKKLVYMNSSQGFKMHQTIKTARNCMFNAIWCYSNCYDEKEDVM